MAHLRAKGRQASYRVYNDARQSSKAMDACALSEVLRAQVAGTGARKVRSWGADERLGS